MKTLAEVSFPVLSCPAARDWEAQLFAGGEAKEWSAMQAAGSAVASALLDDFQEIGGFSVEARLLVLAGKGHNGGDALIAAQRILERFPAVNADVVFIFGERSLRPLAARAWRELQHYARDRVALRPVDSLSQPSATLGTAGRHEYDICIDGIFGFQFRSPAEPRVQQAIQAVNKRSIRLRAAVDLPSANLFRADFTYATGSAKAPLLDSEVAGRIRFLDLGFFSDQTGSSLATDTGDRILTIAALDALRCLRPANSDKRHYGHVFVIGGSRGYPGAVLMCATAALRSGAGLVTAFVPESLAASFAARLPEVMWVGWPETPSGSLALEGEHLLRQRIDRADVLVVGPGVGREPETLALIHGIVSSATVPVAIDADALQGEIIAAGSVPRVITPHAGEFKRIAGDASLQTFASAPNLNVVLKGPITRLCDGGPVYHSPFGGPVLARGGSGDLLAGMLGTQLAQCPKEPLLAAARAVVWHGCAADLLARARGQVAVNTTQLLDYLGPALREI